jgi:hypothetical protein
MIKHISPVSFPFFKDYQSWIYNRKLTNFSSYSQFYYFQKEALNNILKFHKISSLKDIVPSDKLPNIDLRNSYFFLRRSGTSGSTEKQREYRYSLPEYHIIEDHHMWKIEKSHNMELEGGIVVSIAYHPLPHGQDIPIQESMKPKIKDNFECCIFGPYRFFPLGGHNFTYFWYYNEATDKKIWQYNINLVKKMSPKFVQLTPSTLQIINFFSDTKIDVPCIVTGETLYEEAKSDMVFSKSIDKMRCWDGGLSWFECICGRKHIYDELCFVENISGIITSTDLHNRSMPFIRYANHDYGDLMQGMCECGLYGNYFEEFYGKSMESLLINDKIMSGSIIYNIIASFLRHGKYNFCGTEQESRHYKLSNWILKNNPFESIKILWKIHQDLNQKIWFKYHSEPDIDDLQLQCLQGMLDFTFYQNENKVFIVKENKETFNFKPNMRSKSLSITSDIMRQKYNNCFLSQSLSTSNG